MVANPYSVDIRSVECERCGAPLEGSPKGGMVTCAYCRATLQLAGRVVERRQETRIDEPSRLAGLRAQLASWDANESVRVPAGLEHFASMLDNPTTRAAGIEAVRQAWEKTRAVVMANPGANPAAEEHLFRLALFVAEQYREASDHLRARALLETALGLMADPDLRDVLRSRLARAAALAGDRAAAAGWLADVNPRPIHLEPDSEYRTARALLAHLEGQPRLVLDLLGSQNDAVPIPASILLSCLRAHALAALGDEVAARSIIGESALQWGLRANLLQWQACPGASSSWVAEASQQATSQREKKVARLGRSIAAIQVVFVVFLGSLIFGNCGTPACIALKTCGDDGLYELTMRRLNECSESRALLGDDIGWTVGMHYCEGEGNRLDCTMAVAGSKGSGTVTVRCTDSQGQHLLFGTLETPKGKVDLATCKRE